jgi:hypothetical protein
MSASSSTFQQHIRVRRSCARKNVGGRSNTSTIVSSWPTRPPACFVHYLGRELRASHVASSVNQAASYAPARPRDPRRPGRESSTPARPRELHAGPVTSSVLARSRAPPARSRAPPARPRELRADEVANSAGQAASSALARSRAPPARLQAPHRRGLELRATQVEEDAWEWPPPPLLELPGGRGGAGGRGRI